VWGGGVGGRVGGGARCRCGRGGSGAGEGKRGGMLGEGMSERGHPRCSYSPVLVQ